MPTCAYPTATPGEGCFGKVTLGLMDITERPEFSSGYTRRHSKSCDLPQPFHASYLTARSALGCRRQSQQPRCIPSLRCHGSIRIGRSPCGNLFSSTWMRPLRYRAIFKNGGARRDRTDDLKLAKLPLSQLSYGPNPFGIIGHSKPPTQHRFAQCETMVGLGRFELPTSRLSSARSNQLSYRPLSVHPCEERETKTAVPRVFF